MIDIKILENNDQYLEFELTQPNDLQGDTSEWDNDDWNYWNNKMAELEANGTKGQLETKVIRLDKKPFIDGTKFFQESNTIQESRTDNRGSQCSNEELKEYREIDRSTDRRVKQEKLAGDGKFKIRTLRDETQGPEIQPE